VVFVSRPVTRGGNDTVVALPDQDGDGVSDETVVFADRSRGMDDPHGLAFHDGYLYVANTGSVVRLPYQAGSLQPPGGHELLTNEIPPYGGHPNRDLVFGLDGLLYVSVGSSCDVCEETDSRRAAILRFDQQGGIPDDNPFYGDDSGGVHDAVWARGLRNAVGIAFHPTSGELWSVVNERDFYGDDVPAEPVDIVKRGLHYGWPYCYPHPDEAGRIWDARFGRGDPSFCETVPAPVHKLQAHTAPLGLAFYTGQMFPPQYQGDAFIGQHGSWNRDIRSGHVGYAVVRVEIGEDHRPTGQESEFATGWLINPYTREFWGRPVDVAQASDGSLLVSDDFGGRVYRIFYVDAQNPTPTSPAPGTAVLPSPTPTAQPGTAYLPSAQRGS
jgi:glucose/arabinose dehydrogenase